MPEIASRQTTIALDERLAFMGIDDDTKARIRKLKPVVSGAIGPALKVFYDKVRTTPETKKFFSSDQHMDAAKGRQEQHWSVITDASFSETYAHAVRGIGKTHARLGLEPRWYIGGYALVVERLIHAVIKDGWPGLMPHGQRRADDMAAAVSGLVKAALLDMELSVSIYLEELDEKRHQQSDVADVSGLDHLGHGADGLFDQHFWIEPRRTLDVDIIRAEPLQALREIVLDMHRDCIDTNPAARRIPQCTEFDADHDALAPAACQGLADQKLVVAAAIEVAGVDQSDVEGGLDGGDALRAVGRAVKIRHAHRAKANRGDGRTVCSKGARHCGIPFIVQHDAR